MLNIVKKLRSGYLGENIIQERVMEGGTWSMTEEWVPNAVTNNQISNRAVVFGNGTSREGFYTGHVMQKFSGLLGADTLQTYGCNAFYRDHTPDFLICTSSVIAKEIKDSGYCNDNVVYTRVTETLKHPGKFYVIPFDPYADAGTTAAYIAAFDGHKKVYLVGFGGMHHEGYNDNVYGGTNGYDAATDTLEHHKEWAKNIVKLCNCYTDVQFIRVTKTGRQPSPTEWDSVTNLSQISFRDIVVQNDL